MSSQSNFNRYEIHLTIECLSHLHLGSGETKPLKTMRDVIGMDKQIDPEVLLIFRGKDNEPFIPATSLKGILRSLVQRSNSPTTDAKRLFGEILDKQKKTGQAGKLHIFGACRSHQGNTGLLPYAQDGIFIDARTAINDDTGTAEENKLFYAEMVAAGTRFQFEMHLYGDSELLESILPLLRSMIDNGFHLGRGVGYGHGKMRLIEDCIEITQRTLKANENPAWLKEGSSDPMIELLPLNSSEIARKLSLAKPLEIKGKTFTFELTSETPFYINDSAYQLARSKNSGDDTSPTMRSLRIKEDQAYLPGTSLMGVLRARMEWLEELDALNDETLRKVYEEDDDREIPRKPSSRLFGRHLDKSGIKPFAGLLKVKSIMNLKSNDERTILTSVKLDRFSGSPVNGALFSTDCYYSPQFQVKLFLENRLSSDEAFQDDCKRLKRLLAKVKKDGLMIGHATNRGFGWFEIENICDGGV